MKNKHATLIALTVVLTLVLMNAAVLPRLLARAQSLPVEEVAEQVVIADGERLPLPKIPEGIDGYELAFSRAMTEAEQRMWDDAGKKVADNGTDTGYAEIVFAPRAYAQLERSLRDHQIIEEYLQEMMSEYRHGAAQEGELQIDIGTVTVMLPDALDDKTALRLQESLYRRPYDDKLMDSKVDYMYGLMYIGYMWTEPWDSGALHMTRGLCTDESERMDELRKQYKFEGLRPSGPPPMSPPEGDGLWFDEGKSTVHMPQQYQLTDEEMLQYLDLQVIMSAKAAIDTGAKLIDEMEAMEEARALVQQLFSLNPTDYRANAALTRLEGANDGKPMWIVLFQSIQNPIDEYADIEIELDAQGAGLIIASREMAHDFQGIVNGPTKRAQREAWAAAAREVVEPLLLGGVSITGTQLNGSSLSGYGEVEYLKATHWVVNLSGGADYQVGVAVDGTVTSVRYWPHGCMDNG